MSPPALRTPRSPDSPRSLTNKCELPAAPPPLRDSPRTLANKCELPPAPPLPPRDSPRMLAKRRSSVKALGSEGSAAALGLQLPDVLGIQQQLWSTMLPRAMPSPSRMQPPPAGETSSQWQQQQPLYDGDGNETRHAPCGDRVGGEKEEEEDAAGAVGLQQKACGGEKVVGDLSPSGRGALHQGGDLSPSGRGAGSGSVFAHLDERAAGSGGGEAAVGGHIDTMHLLTAMTNANLQGSRGRLVVVAAAGDGGGDSKRQMPSSLLQKLVPQRPFVGQRPLPPLALAAVNKTSSLYGTNNGKKSVTVLQIDFSGVGPAKKLEG